MLQFVTDHWIDICAALTALLALARTIVKITPSTADDEIEAKIESVVLALLPKQDEAKQ
jgi:hypothetical protein